MSRLFDPLSLRLFVAVCDEKNIARAAAREALVASAVSKRVSALEAWLGTPLLVRNRRGIEPTAAGLSLLRQARQLLGSMERMRAEMSEFASGAQDNVRVLASVSALAEWLPDDIAAFVLHHPRLSISLAEQASLQIVKDVREGKADLGLVWDAVGVAGLQTSAYRSDCLCVVLPTVHPLSERQRLRFVDTLPYPSVGISPGGLVDIYLQRQAALLGYSLVHRIQVSSLEAGCRIVAAGLGLAVLPHQAVAPQLAALSLVVKPLAESWALRRFVLVTRETSGLSAGTRLLLEYLTQRGASVQNKLG